MNNLPRYPQHVRNNLRFCELTVLRVEHISAGFQYIVFGGEALDGFTSHGFDDHSKLSFPQPDAYLASPAVTGEGIIWSGGPRPLSRDCAPLHNELHYELVIDFFIHGGGVASSWTMQAQSGNKPMAAGLRDSLVVPEDYAYQLYVCDESGIPALRRRLEASSELAVKPQVSAPVSMRDNACQDYLVYLDGSNIEWLAYDEQAIGTCLAQMQILANDYLIWITGEGKVVRNLNRHFEAE